jgi:hypothetical protein
MIDGKEILLFVHPLRIPPDSVIEFWKGQKVRTVMHSKIAGKFACVTFKDVDMFKDSRGNIVFSCKAIDAAAEKGDFIFEEVEKGLIAGYYNG